jgi:hypothetical protein
MSFSKVTGFGDPPEGLPVHGDFMRFNDVTIIAVFYISTSDLIKYVSPYALSLYQQDISVRSVEWSGIRAIMDSFKESNEARFMLEHELAMINLGKPYQIKEAEIQRVLEFCSAREILGLKTIIAINCRTRDEFLQKQEPKFTGWFLSSRLARFLVPTDVPKPVEPPKAPAS